MLFEQMCLGPAAGGGHFDIKITAAGWRFLHVTLSLILKHKQIYLCTKFDNSVDTSFVEIGLNVHSGVPSVAPISKSNMATM